MKLNVPQEEAKDYVGRAWNRDMGYLFENIEKMDIQEKRRNTNEAREALEKAEVALGKEKHRADEAEVALKKTESALADALKEMEELKKQLGK